MAETLKLVGVGGLGLMLSPSAKHLQPGGPARFLRIHDRGTQDARRDASRAAWKTHGADLVSTFEELVGDGELDGVVVCAGKNGDDLAILSQVVPLLQKNCAKPAFILHLSTVSAAFVNAAFQFCQSRGMAYANYPLTGGPAGAEAATMLILASGDPKLYRRLEAFLQTIGRPKYFGDRVSAGAEVKLIGQFMVFDGLSGIATAAALHARCFNLPLPHESQVEFFDFLNAGAGGTRQWEVALSKGIKDGVWDQGFMLHHAVVDAIYAAQLGIEKGLAYYAIWPMLYTALAFAFLLHHYPE
ncbi:MAG: NAD(P)-dependent oxidoreductase, partial [Calditrichaeota bacterium]